MLQYLINTTAIWLLSLLVFDIFLKRESYHGYNRFYLVGTFLLGIVAPLLSWDDASALYTSAYSRPVMSVISARQSVVGRAELPGEMSGMLNVILFYFYLAGVAVSLLMLTIEVVKLTLLYTNGKKSRDGSSVIIETGKNHGPFSLFNYVFVGSRDHYNDEEWATILAHEQLHGVMFHFMDLLFFQLARIAFWFHPLVYVYQRKLLLLHEYQADKACGEKPKAYGQFLVEQALLQHAPSLTHSFNRSPIKYRIIMLTRKSSAASRIKMLLFIPLALVSIICFSGNTFSQDFKKNGNTVTYKGNKITMQAFGITDTTTLTDPVTGQEIVQITKRDPKPVKVNDEQIYEMSEVFSTPQFKSKDFRFPGYLFSNIVSELEMLPDGSYNLNIYDLVVGKKGDLVYYVSQGISKNPYSSGASQPIPRNIEKDVNKKVSQVLKNTRAKPADLKGRSVPVFLNEISLNNSIEVKDHKVSNWP